MGSGDDSKSTPPNLPFLRNRQQGDGFAGEERPLAVVEVPADRFAREIVAPNLAHLHASAPRIALHVRGIMVRTLKRATMRNDAVVTKIRGRERVISTDGVAIGHVWRVHLRDAEAYIEVRPRNLWNALLEALALLPIRPRSSHLFIPARTIGQVARKRVHVRLDAGEARACTSRPPWIEPEELPPAGFNSGRLE
jgi:hypothetical protein